MPKNSPAQSGQSVIGLFRALGADPKPCRARGRSTGASSSSSRAGIAAGRRAAGLTGCRPSAISRRRCASAAPPSSAPTASSRSRGLVRGYVGRGTFVSAKPDTGSAPFAWRGKIAAAGAPGEPTRRCAIWCAPPPIPRLMSLAAGEPALDCFPTEAFHRAMNDVLAKRRRRRPGVTAPTEGRPRFRAALAERFGGDPEHILVIAGAQQGLDLLARCLVDPGDAVILDRPGLSRRASRRFRNAGARLVGWDIARADVDELEELLLRYRPKLIYTNPTHQNPTGVTLPIRTRRELLELAARYRVPIVEDDTYRELSLAVAAAAVALQARRGAQRRHPHQQLLEDARAGAAPGLDRRGAADRRAARADQAAGRSAHAEPVAARRLASCSSSGVFDRHLVTLQGGASAAPRRDGRRRCASTCRPARCGSRARRRDVPVVPARRRRVGRAAVRDRGLRESVIIVTGEPFYVDRGRRAPVAAVLHGAAGRSRGRRRQGARAGDRHGRARALVARDRRVGDQAAPIIAIGSPIVIGGVRTT